MNIIVAQIPELACRAAGLRRHGEPKNLRAEKHLNRRSASIWGLDILLRREAESKALSALRTHLNLKIRCRHGKCAVERASSLEGTDQLIGFVLTDSGQRKVKPDRIE